MSRQEANSLEGKVLLCYHCGNKTFMHKVTDYKWEWESGEGCIWGSYTWALYFCPVCHKVTLEETEIFSEYEDPEIGLIPMEKILFPAVNTNSNMPYEVSGAFEAALKVRNIDGAVCLIALRRTLEMMCKDKGANRRNLYEKLKYLSCEGVLPPIIDKMADILKNWGNMAAHADSQKFAPDLVNSMVDFTETILEYVYVLPAKLDEIQTIISEKSETDS